jgi:hypothetical protein
MVGKTLFAITPLLAAYAANAQVSVESIDNTLNGLRFQKVNINAAQGQMTFGIALPNLQTGRDDFIGQLVRIIAIEIEQQLI